MGIKSKSLISNYHSWFKMDRTGSTVIGKRSKYKITNLIAKGGMGTVYSCIDDRNNEYAIKFFPGKSKPHECLVHHCVHICLNNV